MTTPLSVPAPAGGVDGARLPLRPELADEAPYGAPQLDVPVLLNVNENPYAPSEAVVETIARYVADAARGLNRYPDRDFAALRGDLADYLALESGVRLAPEQVWAANGSNEVMLHLLQAFGGPGRTAVSFAPTYSMYPEYARDTHTRWVTGRRESDFTLDVDHAVATIEEVRPSVILLASPNNPTGTALPLATVEAILAAAARIEVPDAPLRDGRRAGAVVVVDEAYAEFRRPGTPSALELLAANPHLAVSRTMSKAFAAAGLRLGYLAAAPALVDALRVVRLPYHLSAVTQAAARGALAHHEELRAQVRDLRGERDALVAWLREQRVDGRPLQVADSDANFVLFGTFGDRHAVWQRLLDRGVLIRETGPEGWLRVSVGTPAENAAFRAAFTEVVGQVIGAEAPEKED
ncbi:MULTISPECIES: histidinol-phosphate transaminase [unclassified Isoptericola]|uniref:histidinol-phosphate transaminase n=1 Tax=unclassified Isoptericola TaxID=2623355 RepID=UPI00364AAD0C